MEVTLVKVELNCATTTSGALCVMILGILLMPMWSVDSWDLLQQVINQLLILQIEFFIMHTDNFGNLARLHVFF